MQQSTQPVIGQTHDQRPLPTPGSLYDPVLRVFGRLTQLQAEVGVPLKQIIDSTLVEIGIDPAAMPPLWRHRVGKQNMKGRELVCLAVKGLKERKLRSPVFKAGNALWALTPVGVEQAKTLLDALVPPKPQPNLTAKWFDKHLRKPELMRLMRQALSKHLPVSARTHQIEDHMQEYFLRAIRRDAFAKVLAEGGDLPYSKVVAYCLNSGRTDARDAGTEPVCRTLFGARTEKERRMQPVVELTEVPAAKTWDSDGSLVPQDEVVTIEDESFEQVWHRIEEMVEEKKPQAWERYSSVLLMIYRGGLTVAEVGVQLNVSRNRAATIIAEARRCVRESLNDRGVRSFDDYCSM